MQNRTLNYVKQTGGIICGKETPLKNAALKKAVSTSLADWYFNGHRALFGCLRWSSFLPTLPTTADYRTSTKCQVAPEAQAMQKKYNVPASITIAQAILESDWGSSKLAAKYHNLFGIKGTGENSQVLTTKEYVNGKWITTKGRFKVYSSWSESIKDHTKLMINGTDYNSQNYQAVTQASDYKEAAKALQEAHYATDPDYAQKLISAIQTYKLYNYDK